MKLPSLVPKRDCLLRARKEVIKMWQEEIVLRQSVRVVVVGVHQGPYPGLSVTEDPLEVLVETIHPRPLERSIATVAGDPLQLLAVVDRL
ncbi:hypothetical protein Avbf_03614 [Armadillidium vulgare]|nr:hypothetical protein Avbf_03614 [Armadillidium vulgare]